MNSNKVAELIGPEVGTYPEVERALPVDYRSLLDPRETQHAVTAVKRHIEDALCRELKLFRVEVPLIVERDSGVNDTLDRDGSRAPIEFLCGLGITPRITTQVVQGASKWNRMALERFDCKPGEGVLTDMRAVRKDYFLDHDHSAYVDQWDWEKVITADQRNLGVLEDAARRIWKVIKGADAFALRQFPKLRDPRYPELPEDVTFIHAEDLLAMYPDLPRRQREAKILSERHRAIFIIGIGGALKDGHPHEPRAADCDDWVTPTLSEDGRPMHGLNGDLLAWNPVTNRGHELASMGVRVTRDTLRRQLEITRQLELLKLPYHQAILDDRVPLSMGGGIGQSLTTMLLLRKAHLGEVSVTVWPKALKEVCERKNIFVLE